MNMTFFQCHSVLMHCSFVESISSLYFSTQNIVRRQLKDTMPMSHNTQDEVAPSINFLSWTTTKQQIIALEFQESFLLHSSTWHSWNSINVSTALSQICALAYNIREITCSHSHLTDGYKLSVTISAPTMLSSPLMVIKCDFFSPLGEKLNSCKM